MEQRMLAAEKSEDRWHEKWKNSRCSSMQCGQNWKKKKKRTEKLTAQVNKVFENPPSHRPCRGWDARRSPTARVKTGKRPGGQPGIRGIGGKLHVPTETHEIPAPKKYQDSPDYYETGKVVRETESRDPSGRKDHRIYYERISGPQDRSAVSMPRSRPDTKMRVNYGGSVKALAFLLGNECNVSHGKIRKLIEELTEGEIRLSDGMINGLCREFSAKTKEEKQEIIKKLMTSPVMNADFTNANVNGGSAQVLVLASPQENVALYIGREKKGMKG